MGRPVGDHSSGGQPCPGIAPTCSKEDFKERWIIMVAEFCLLIL